MNRSAHDERHQAIRGEGVLSTNRSINPISSIDKEKHDKQLKMNSGNEHSGFRAVDLIKPSKQISNAMSHVSVGSAPLPPMPPLQAPLLTSILPGPGHQIIPPGLHALRGGGLPAQIPLMGRAAAAIAPPRAGIAPPTLRASSIPPLKAANSNNQISIPSKGSSIFSPIASSNRAPSSSPASGINRSNEHVKVMDAKITHIQSDIHHPRPGTSSGLPITGTATVQVIASGTAAQAHLAPGPTSKSFSVIPNQNVLKIGSQNLQHSQAPVGVNSNAGYSNVSTYRVAPPNSITFSKLIPQPILIPSTSSGAPSITKPESQEHQRSNATTSTSHGLSSPTMPSSHHSPFSSHHPYGLTVPIHTTTNPSHSSYLPNDSKNDRLKPGNPSLQYTIGSYFPIDSGFPHPIGVHPFTSNSPFHPYVRTPSGSSYPMFVEGTRGYAAPLPIPGMSSSSRDSHHHASPDESSPVMNSSFSMHNFPNLQPSSYHPSAPSSNNSSPRPGPGILRKRTADGYPIHGLDRISSPTKQEPRNDHRQDSRSEGRQMSGSSNVPPRQESPRLLCDEKSTYNENNMPVADTSLYSSNSSFSTTNTDSKRDTDQPATPMSLHLPNSVHQNLISVSSSSGISTEASPRKKPRKQNVILTEDKYGSKVSMEDDEVIEEKKSADKRNEKKSENAIIRIQKPVVKYKQDETIEDVKEKEPVEPDENLKYYMFMSRRRSSALGDYKINSKAAHHHFYRYSDVKSKDEKKPTTAELANNKRILQNISGWRIHHMSSQMDDLCSLENDVCNKLYEFQRELPRPSKQYMLTALCHDLQNGKRFASADEQLRVLHELIQGNIQRCQLSMEQLLEAKQTMLRVVDHKPKILDIIKKNKHKRSSKKKTLPSY